MSSHNTDDLFGDGDSEGSLFGNDDDSLFDGPDGDEEEQIQTSCSSTAAVAGGPSLNCLSLPSVSDPHDALSCCHVGVTSGQHTVSTQQHPSGNTWGLALPEITNFEAAVDAQAFREQAIDTFTLASHGHGDQDDHDPQARTVCPSPEPSPSKQGLMDDLQRFLEEDLLQNQDNQGQHGQPRVPPTAVQQEAEQPNDVEMLMEYHSLRHQAAQSITSALGRPSDMGMGLAELDFHYADAKSRHGIRLPRRIDFEEAGVEVLKPYVSLNRADSALEHYGRLELPEKMGKLLFKDMKDYISLSPDVQHLRQKGRIASDTKRLNFLSAALRILKDEGWGAKWFGPTSPTGGTRSLVWPSDSSLLVMRFTSLLYKVADQVKYLKKGRRQSPPSTYTFGGHSEALPIDLTNDDNMTPGGTVPVYRSPAFAVADATLRPDFYITESPSPSVSPLGSASTSHERERSAVPPRQGITLDMLAEQVADIRSRKQKSPEARPVKYRLTFTDTRDEQDLRPPVVGVIADEIVKSDKAVRTITSAFRRAGIPATIHIETPEGRVEVASQEEWNEAVDAVWGHHGEGAIVQVGIHV